MNKFDIIFVFSPIVISIISIILTVWGIVTVIKARKELIKKMNTKRDDLRNRINEGL